MPPQRGLPPPRRDGTLRSSSSGKHRPAITTEDQRGLRGPRRQGRGVAAGGAAAPTAQGSRLGSRRWRSRGTSDFKGRDDAGEGPLPERPSRTAGPGHQQHSPGATRPSPRPRDRDGAAPLLDPGARGHRDGWAQVGRGRSQAEGHLAAVSGSSGLTAPADHLASRQPRCPQKGGELARGGCSSHLSPGHRANPQARLCWRRKLTGWGEDQQDRWKASGPAGAGQGLRLRAPPSAAPRAMRGGARGDRRLKALSNPQRV